MVQKTNRKKDSTPKPTESTGKVDSKKSDEKESNNVKNDEEAPKVVKGVIKQGTIAEFMRKRTQLVGFDVGLNKHTQYMAEFADNALDAIEVGFWKDPKLYRLKEDFYFE